MSASHQSPAPGDFSGVPAAYPDGSYPAYPDGQQSAVQQLLQQQPQQPQYQQPPQQPPQQPQYQQPPQQPQYQQQAQQPQQPQSVYQIGMAAQQDLNAQGSKAKNVETLAASVSAKMLEVMLPLFEAMQIDITRLVAEVSMLKATVVVSGAGGARAAPARSRTAASSAVAATGGSGIDVTKIKNKRLFFRWRCIQDSAVRDEWLTYRPTMTKVGSAEAFNALISDPKITAKSGDDLISTKAFTVWAVLGKDDQEVWDGLFKKWRSESTAAATPGPLAVDAPAAAGQPTYSAASAEDIQALLGGNMTGEDAF